MVSLHLQWWYPHKEKKTPVTYGDSTVVVYWNVPFVVCFLNVCKQCENNISWLYAENTRGVGCVRASKIGAARCKK